MALSNTNNNNNNNNNNKVYAQPSERYLNQECLCHSTT